MTQALVPTPPCPESGPAAVPSRAFPAGELQDCTYEAADSITWVADERLNTRRWTTDRRLIFRANDTGQLYQAVYSVGNTECQDSDWFGDVDPVVCLPVREVPKTVTTYEAIRSASGTS